MRDLLSHLPNIPQADVPVGTDETANVEIIASASRANLISSRKITLIWAKAWAS
jgi:seryl-tRNA synthetase